MKILKTKNYEWFKFLNSNRKISSPKKLIKSIQNNDITAYNPIIVTNDGYIIDGQHRFEACRALGKPIYYLICDVDPKKAMVSLNTTGNYWRIEEWFNYYVNERYEPYVKLQALMKEYNYNHLSNAIVIFSQGSINAQDFKQGKLKDKSEFFRPMMEFLKGLEMPFGKTTYRPFIVALKNIFAKYYYEPRGKQKIEKLRKKIIAIPSYRGCEDYERAMENYIKMRI